MPEPRPLDEIQARTSFARFRVASIVEGIALLVLCVIMVMRYIVFSGTETQATWEQVSSVWSPIHGLIYMVYVILGFDLWLKMRWNLPRMLLLMFFGVIPVLSFVGERWTHARVDHDLRTRPTIQDAERAGA